MPRFKQVLTFLIIVVNISLISPSLPSTTKPDTPNKIQATVTKSFDLHNIQFNYSSQLPAELDETVTYYFLFNFTVLFTNISSSTNISRAVFYESFLSIYKQPFNYENVTQLTADNFWGPTSDVKIDKNEVSFNENVSVFLSGQFSQSTIYMSPSFTFSYTLNSTTYTQFIIWDPLSVKLKYNPSTSNLIYSSILHQFFFNKLVPIGIALVLLVIVYINYRKKYKE